MAYRNDYYHLDFEVKGHVGYITFNNPKTLNALTYRTMKDLVELFDEMEKDRNIWGVILTGTGRSFISGADLKDGDTSANKLVNDGEAASDLGTSFNEGFRIEANRDDRCFVHSVYNRILNFDRPTIAAINGYALGGGAELALCCDIRIGSKKAKIGFPEAHIANIPGYTGPSRAVRVMGAAFTAEMMMTGYHYPAEEILHYGFFSKVVEPEELMPTAEEFMARILRNSPLAVKFNKIMANRSAEMTYEASLELERLISAILLESQDGLEGMSAFLEKRDPQWKNC